VSVDATASPARRFGRRPKSAADAAQRRSLLNSPLLASPAVLFLIVAFFAPLAVLVLYSLWPTSDSGQIIHRLTLDNYSRAFSSTYLKTLIRTFWFVGLSSLITVVLVFPFAYFVAAKSRPSRRIFWILLAILPFWTSYLIRVFAWQNLFGDTGLINDALQRIHLISEPLAFFGFNRPAIVITFVYLLFPLAFLTAYITLERMDPTLLEASSDLGARPWRRMTRIILPIARTGLIAGFILSFITMAGDYVTPQLIGGSQGSFFANLITNQFGSSLQWGFGAALSLVLLVGVFTLLLLLRKTAGEVQAAGEYTRQYVKSRSPFLLAYSFLFIAFLYIPIALLLLFSFNDSTTVGFPINGFTTQWFDSVLNDPQVADAFSTSISVAFVAVGASLALGTPAAMYFTRGTGKLRTFGLAVVATPLFLPPVVLGLSIIIGLHQLNVTRGLWTIMIGHTIIVLPIVTLLIVTRLEGLDRNQELAAQDLGAKPWQRFIRITLPLALPVIIAGAMIGFAVSMDEFIMTFLVTGNQTTLPLYIFGSIRFVISPELTAISCLLLGASFLLIVLGAFIAFGRDRITSALARS
jgi:ABC-type spermidine/putrescine transport system permease subunit I